MKLFSILNKPAVKAGNKQAGLVFLEYVIMAFIITVAVIFVPCGGSIGIYNR